MAIAHAAVPGRARLRIAALYRNPAVGDAVREAAARMAGVSAAEVNPRTSGLLLRYDPDRALEALIAELERALPAIVADARRLDTGEPWRPTAGIRRRLLRLCARAGKEAEVPSGIAAELPAPAAPYHTLAAADAIGFWESHPQRGLDAARAAERLARLGANRLPPPRVRSELSIFVDQFTNLPVAMLAASAVLSAATGAPADAGAILVVVLANGIIGYVTESQAQRTILSLERGGDRTATVVRDGSRIEIDATELVPGDLMVVAPGTLVAADARLVTAERLTVDESSLSGESEAVAKDPAPIDEPRLPLADRRNMLFRGTLVTGGSGTAVVVGTGAATEMGGVSQLAGAVGRRQTPLEQQLNHLGRQLVIASSAICAGVFGVGLLRGYRLVPMLQTAVSLAVAAVPEGLPTVAITTLAVGIRRMREHKVLVRHLSAVETLGAIEVMCLDKTGTITENRMQVVALMAGRRVWTLDGERLVARGEAAPKDEPLEDPALRRLLEMVSLCSEAELVGAGEVDGSPTEAALVRAALVAGIDVAALRAEHPCLATRYRSERRGLMDTLHRRPDGGVLLAVKGRPAEVLARCEAILLEGREQPLTGALRARIVSENERMAGNALRVLGVAYRRAPAAPLEAESLVWLGMAGMTDPPRPGIAELLRRFHRAGIDTMMITGDQSATAHAIGKRIGVSAGDRLEILDSTRLERIEPEVLESLVHRVHVFSRVSPVHKLSIVRALQQAGRVVAMTGDGINDSPALKAADVGVAMGTAGTPAAREVADVVLEDDELTTMLAAVEQGRTIYDDIKKAVHFILATNISEILLTFGAVTAGVGQPLTPMQLLWINIVTDVFPELALAQQPPARDVMARPPRSPARPMFDRRDLARIAREGTLITAGAGAAYAYGLVRHGPGPRAGTVAFTALTCAQLLHAISTRSQSHTIFDRHAIARNKYIPITLGVSFVLQLATVMVPAARRVFGTVPLGAGDWTIASLTSAASLVGNEIIKVLVRPHPRPDATEY